jgi:hypothetical protein
MSDLSTIASEPKAKRSLKGVNFDFVGAHLAYTDISQGGAASLLNEPYLLKADELEKSSILSEEQKAILDKIGEESTPLDKSAMTLAIDGEILEGQDLKDSKLSKEASSSSSPVVGEVAGEELENSNQETTEKSTVMDQDILDMQKELAGVKTQLAVSKAQNEIRGFEFEAEIEKGLAQAIASLDDEAKDFVIKALDTLKAQSVESKEALDKAKEQALAEGDNALAKALGEEAGHEEAEEGPLSFSQQVAKAQDEQKGDK